MACSHDFFRSRASHILIFSKSGLNLFVSGLSLDNIPENVRTYSMAELAPYPTKWMHFVACIADENDFAIEKLVQNKLFNWDEDCVSPSHRSDQR